MWADWLFPAVGLVLVLVSLRDIFHTLAHPRCLGGLSGLVFTGTWRLARAWGRPTELAGPLGLVLTVATWTGLVVLGCALAYYPNMPAGFHLGSSVTFGEDSSAVDSLYLSLVAVGTLGLGDIVPATTPLRLLVPTQALIGFVLLTAGISWVLQIYPALTRRRAVARRLRILARTDASQVVAAGEPSVAFKILDDVTAGITQVEMDLTTYGESYFFRENNADLSFAATVPYAEDLIQAGLRSPHREVRMAASMLERAVASLVETLRGFPAGHGSPDHVLTAFARDHGHAGAVQER